MKNLVVILGPTGVGKTDISINVAQHLNVPIINADSRQIFIELPIGTASPTRDQQKKNRHYFVGTHHIQDYYSASLFETDVIHLLQQLFQTSDVALLSGGSMMYIDAVCNGLDDIPTVDKKTRSDCMEVLNEHGLETLLEELKQLDPSYYAIVDKNNWRRVVHAVEICRFTGKTFTSFRKYQPKPRPFNIIKVGLNRPREELYSRINMRVLQMIDAGLVDEARRVYPFKGLQSLDTVGYRELFEYFDGKLTLSEAIENIQSNTRRYMRKQLTWFKRDESIHWFNPNELNDIISFIDKSLAQLS
jgi:tRNA dimethylallyltransferase